MSDSEDDELISKKAKYTKKEELFHPTKNGVIKILKSEPNSVFVDEEGRLYGKIKKSPLKDDMVNSGTLSENDELLWIFLSSHKKGQWQKRSQYKTNEITVDEELIYPEVGTIITLKSYTDETLFKNAIVEEYPERIYRNRTTSVRVSFL